jgi:hypothetical protein
MDGADRSAGFCNSKNISAGAFVSRPHVELMCVDVRATPDAAEHEDALSSCAVMLERSQQAPRAAVDGMTCADARIETNVAHKIVKMARHRR